MCWWLYLRAVRYSHFWWLEELEGLRFSIRYIARYENLEGDGLTQLIEKERDSADRNVIYVLGRCKKRENNVLNVNVNDIDVNTLNQRGMMRSV
jgi:hypothetical protein